MAAKLYRITVRGCLGERFAGAFEGMAFELAAGETVLVGELSDQAALYGLLERLRDLGLELLRIESGTV